MVAIAAAPRRPRAQARRHAQDHWESLERNLTRTLIDEQRAEPVAGAIPGCWRMDVTEDFSRARRKLAPVAGHFDRHINASALRDNKEGAIREVRSPKSLKHIEKETIAAASVDRLFADGWPGAVSATR